MIITTDDLCMQNLKNFRYWDAFKKKKPDLKLVAFTIANYKGVNMDCEEFREWYDDHKDWVEIGVHSYDHERPQEGWRDDQEDYMRKAKDILEPYLPERPLYRPPGFRFFNNTESILKKLGFAGIAHQQFVKYFDGEMIPVFNTHCTFNKYNNAIGMIWESLK